MSAPAHDRVMMVQHGISRPAREVESFFSCRWWLLKAYGEWRLDLGATVCQLAESIELREDGYLIAWFPGSPDPYSTWLEKPKVPTTFARRMRMRRAGEI